MSAGTGRQLISRGAEVRSRRRLVKEERLWDTPAALKILFLTVKKDSPSARWRVLQFLPHFQKAGVECEVLEWPGGMLAGLRAARKGAEHDLVFLQKRLLPKLLANRLRRNARSLVFEFDDVLTLKRNPEGGVRGSPTRERRFRRIVKYSDAVIVTNDYLAELARRAGAGEEKVNVFPSVIDLSQRPVRPPRDNPDPVVLGWMGTPQNLHSMEILRTPLVRLCRRHENLEVRIVCEEPLRMEDVRLANRPYRPGAEVEEIGDFDIALAPLVEDSWTRGKISTKILAYLAGGRPVVASDVGANRLYLRDGENGFLAGTLSDWEDRLSRLIEDPALRRTMGAKARECVEREYSIEAMVPRYLGLFEKLVSGRR